MKIWRVPYRRTLNGWAEVEAKDESDAIDKFNAGIFDSDPGEEMVDWEIIGAVRESR